MAQEDRDGRMRPLANVLILGNPVSRGRTHSTSFDDQDYLLSQTDLDIL